LLERTLSIVKPDAVSKNKIGEIVRVLEGAGLRVAAAKFLRLSKADAERFYVVHRQRPFYESLTTFMSEGPILVMVLEGENAILRNRDVMGATDPAKAVAGTIRKLVGTNVERNAVHGSDAPETAKWEIAFFFSEMEMPSRE
jgi:nucleoside-diphosphate kinase